MVDRDDTATNGTAGDAASIEGCTKKLRQEVSTLSGIPFPTGHFQCLEQLVAAVRLMGRNVVVIVETDNQCSIAGFSSPIKRTTGTIHEVRKCNRQALDAKLHWHTPTSAVEVVALQRGGTQQGERTSMIYVASAHKTSPHYEEFQGKLDNAKVSTMIGGAYLTGQYKAGKAMTEKELLQEYWLQPVMADEETKRTDKATEADRDPEEQEEREA